MAGFAVETHGLTKTFGSRAVVDGVDLRVPTGSVFGFLGPNGAGKTTTVRMLLGLVAPTSGTVSLLGNDMPAASSKVLPNVGALVDSPAFYSFLDGRQNLQRFDAMGRRRGERRADVDGALRLVGLTASAHKRFGDYSLGMRQRLAIASALMRKRELLVLDEPTNGLDPQGTREVRHVVQRLAAEGTTVFISSHLLSEIDLMCTDVAVLSAGRIVAQGPIGAVRAHQQKRARFETPDVDAAQRVMAEVSGVGDVSWDASSVSVAAEDVPVDVLVAALVGHDVRVTGVSTSGGSLEDAFVALTGEGFDVAE